MNKIAAALILSGGLLLIGQPAQGVIPQREAAPRAAAPSLMGAGGVVIAKKPKAPKPAGDKKAAKGADADSGNKKPFPTKAEALKDIDDISKK